MVDGRKGGDDNDEEGDGDDDGFRSRLWKYVLAGVPVGNRVEDVRGGIV